MEGVAILSCRWEMGMWAGLLGCVSLQTEHLENITKAILVDTNYAHAHSTANPVCSCFLAEPSSWVN